MNLIFIRHAEPDYDHNTITKKGWREAELLSERTSQWNVRDFYQSPLGRAKDTASCTLKKMNRSALTCDWLKEFWYSWDDPATGKTVSCWDFLPKDWTVRPGLYDKNQWMNEIPFISKPEIYENYISVNKSFDAILAEHGYERHDGYYLVKEHNDDNLVFFCHFGITCVLMSHIMGLSPIMLWQNTFIAPTGVTVLCSEERTPGIASFRAQFIGDTSHLRIAGEPVSKSGYFTDTFNG